jgi:hypothetical protein
MKISTILVAACCTLVAASSLLGRQPAPDAGAQPLPAPLYPGEAPAENDDDFWAHPPLPPLPYAFTWDEYAGAAVEHDAYGYQRLHPPPKKTISCDGWLAGVTDSVVVMFSYPTPHRPPPMYCPKGRCVPGKFSYGACSRGCSCQAHVCAAPVVYEPAMTAPHPLPEPMLEPAHVSPPRPVLQPRLAPANPMIPPVLVEGGLPAQPLLPEESTPAVIAPMPPPVLTEEPSTGLPPNEIPMSELPRNRIPARTSGR